MDTPKYTKNDLLADISLLVIKYARAQGIDSGDAWYYPLLGKLVQLIVDTVGE